MVYLRKRYRISFNARTAEINNEQHSNQGNQLETAIQIFQIKNFNVKIDIRPEDPEEQYKHAYALA